MTKKNTSFNAVLVIGGGIAGVQAALDLADSGIKVYLVEKSPSIGGRMAQLDKTFPTNDCSMCILAPKLVAAVRHKNITLLTNSELVALKGKEGNFKVKIKKKPRFVKEDCVGCGECIKYCPIVLPNEFDLGLGSRKAIYTPFPQAVPSMYVIDLENCLNKAGIIVCKHCIDNCEKDSIDFDAKEEYLELAVSSIIVATGFEQLDPRVRKEYGYGRFENVLTSLEYERLLSASGPTGGTVVRPTDLKSPKSIAFIQCVGSRSEQGGYPYCSRVCCMYATKEASILKESRPEVEIYIFYMDLRAYGKGFQEYYKRAEALGINYIRARPSKIYENEDKTLTLRYKNTYTNKIEERKIDLVVLCSAVVPSRDNEKLAEILGIELDSYGFFKSKTLLSDPTSSTKPGIYLAGCAQAPRDIPDSVAQASASAMNANIVLKNLPRSLAIKPPEEKTPAQKPRIGVYICKCGKNIAGYLDTEYLAEHSKYLPNVVHTAIELFACSEDSLRRLKEDIEKYNLNRLVIAACSPITHAPIFQEVIQESGLNKYLLEFANIRNHCSWVHSQSWELATEKAFSLLRMAIAKSLFLEPLKEYELKVSKRALVVGGGIAGIKASLALAKLGIHVYLIEREKELGGKLRTIYKLFPSDISAEELLKSLFSQLAKLKNIEIFTNVEITQITGYVGNFEAEILVSKKKLKLNIGTIILATGCKELEPNSYLYGKHENIITQLELESRLRKGNLGNTFRNIVIINCVDALTKEKPYCCRIGCGISIKNVKLLKQIIPEANIFVLYKDLRMFGKAEEEYFAEVLQNARPYLIRYEKEPEVKLENNELKVKVYDELLADWLEIDTDLLVLTTQLEGDPSVEKFKKILKLTLGQGNFWSEAHAKLRPLEFLAEGLYLCGSAHYPQNLADCIAQASGVAAKACIPMIKGYVKGEGIVPKIDKGKCTRCELCIKVCPYEAIEKVDNEVQVKEALCKGCGICSASCLNGAAQQQGFNDLQILPMIDTSWLKKEI